MEPYIFHSNLFAPYLPDECQVNPNVLGFEFAHWLSVELSKLGMVTSYPDAEDWGWFLEYMLEGKTYMICCSGYADEQGNYVWQYFIESPKTIFGRPRGDEKVMASLLARIAQSLNAAGIQLANGAPVPTDIVL